MSPAQNTSATPAASGCPHAAGRQLFMGVRTTGPVDCKWSLTDKSVQDPHPHQAYKYDGGDAHHCGDLCIGALFPVLCYVWTDMRKVNGRRQS